MKVANETKGQTKRDTNQGVQGSEPVPAASSIDTNDQAGDTSSVAERLDLAEEAEKKVGDAPRLHLMAGDAAKPAVRNLVSTPTPEDLRVALKN